MFLWLLAPAAPQTLEMEDVLLASLHPLLRLHVLLAWLQQALRFFMLMRGFVWFWLQRSSISWAQTIDVEYFLLFCGPSSSSNY